MSTLPNPLAEFWDRIRLHIDFLWRSLDFACLATNVGEEWVLLTGRATLSTEPPDPQPRLARIVDLPNLRAYSARLKPDTIERLLLQLGNSKVMEGDPQDHVHLISPDSQPYLWYPVSSIPCTPRPGQKEKWPRGLRLLGSTQDARQRLSQNLPLDIDKRLRQHLPQAYNGLQALCANLGLEFDQHRTQPYFELGAHLPARFLSCEAQRKETTKLSLQMQYVGLPQLMIEWLPQRQSERIAVPGCPSAKPAVFTVEIPIPPAATEAEARLLIADEDADQLKTRVARENILLRISEFFDEDQEKLSHLLFTENNLKNANAFELGVARLLSLAGYTVLWFGKASKEALPDIVAYARTPLGAEHLIYGECTLKNPGEKISDLATRATKLEDHLKPSEVDVLPVIFSRNPATDLERQAAFQSGVALRDGDDIRKLQQAINSDASVTELYDILRLTDFRQILASLS